MVNFPPLSMTIGWFSAFIDRWIEKGDEQEAIEYANTFLSSSKEFGRMRLKNVKNESLALSVAIEGGGRALRSFDNVSDACLSDHGNWKKNHLGAFEACLGKKPFFRHLLTGLEKPFTDETYLSLRDFNSAIFNTLKTFLIGNAGIEAVALYKKDPIVKARGRELLKSIDPDISLIQAVADYGQETLLAVMAFEN